jgi:predicted metallopeptidase
MPSVADLELARLRALTASEKVAVMHSLWRQAWSLKSAGVRAHHPEWSPERVEAKVREIFRRDPDG